MDYNERLFNSKNNRGKLHLSRYIWLKKKVNRYYPSVRTVLELGCFDGKALDYLPQTIDLYHGYDANWEGGLDKAEKCSELPNLKFFLSKSIDSFNPTNNAFDISICMETLEHLPLSDLDLYLKKLANSTREFCFVTVPNEKGIVLLVKYLIKKYYLRNISEKYSMRELGYALVGKMDKVERNEGKHKGFDFLNLLKKLEDYFQVVDVEGIPFAKLPYNINFTIGIVLKKRK